MAVQSMPLAPSVESPARAVMTAEATRTVNRITGIAIGIAMSALSIGVTLGVVHRLEHAGFDV